MASGLLDGTLREIGTDADEFIDACQLRLSEPDAGPRDAAMKSMLKQLFTYENFIIFRKMMYDKNKALEDEERFEREFQEQSLQYRQQQELASQLSSSPASSERFPSPTRSPRGGSVLVFSGPWACPMCTFQNDSGSTTCSVCKHDRTSSAHRPHESPSQQQHHPHSGTASPSFHGSSQPSTPSDRGSPVSTSSSSMLARRSSHADDVLSMAMPSNTLGSTSIRNLLPVQADETIEQVFDYYDVDRDRRLNLNEWWQIPHDFNMGLCEEEVRKAMSMLDTTGTGALSLEDFARLWTLQRDHSTSVDPIMNKLCELRRLVGQHYNIFFGFSFDEWRSAAHLDTSKVSSWSSREVMLWIAYNPDFKVVRTYLDRNYVQDIDGETLLNLRKEDLIEVGIKSMHVNKCLRVIGELRAMCGMGPSEATATAARSPTVQGDNRGGASVEKYQRAALLLLLLLLGYPGAMPMLKKINKRRGARL